MESSGLPDIGPFATEIFDQNFKELVERAPEGIANLSEADRDAVLTAIAKAGWQGILRGIAMVSYEVNQRAEAASEADPDADVIRLDIQLTVDDVPDRWADRHGGQS
jgi:hypothetical protein